jgi:Ner family transcriptional regulator
MSMTSPAGDWPRLDVTYALKRKGWTMQGLADAHGYSRSAVSNAINRPWPAVEELIAGVLDLQPQEIWPSRYNPDGTPKQGIPTSQLPPRPRRRARPRSRSLSVRS